MECSVVETAPWSTVDLAIPEFGYQNHISADRRHRLIRRWLVTDAAAHAGAR